MTRKEYAKQLFSTGSNCSQAVCTAYAPLGTIPEHTAHLVATGFGAGIARNQSICGAVSGAVMVISGMFGMAAGGGQEEKQRTYSEINRFFEWMEQYYPGITCSEILGRKLKTTDEWAKAGKDGLFQTICVDAVSYAADYLEQLARDHIDELLSIREVEPEDTEAVLTVQKAAFASEAKRYDNPELSPMTESSDEFMNTLKNGVVLKALWKNDIIGSVRMRQMEETVHVGRLSVEPRYQRLGIGRRLLKAAEQNSAAATAKRFEIFTGSLSRETIDLYTSEGYRVFKKGTECNGVEVVFMEKKTET